MWNIDMYVCAHTYLFMIFERAFKFVDLYSLKINVFEYI